MKKIFILTLIIFSTTIIFSKETIVNIDSAVTLAKENNIDLKRASLTLSGKNKDKEAAFNVFYPTIDGTATFSRSNTEPTTQGVSENNLSLGYSASFNFTPALFNAITLLKRDYELGEITYYQAEKDIEKNVKRIFYNIILLEEQIKLLEDNLKTIKARYDLMRLNYEAGLVSELDLLTAQVSYENFKPEIYSLKNIYSETLMNFKNMLGIDLKENVIIEGEINPIKNILSIDEIFDLALIKNRNILMLGKGLEVYKAQKKAEFSRSFLPVVSIQYSSGTILNDPFGNDRFKEDNFMDDNGMFSLSLYYSFMGLLPNSAERMKLDKIDRNIKDLNLQNKALLEGIKLQITNHVNRLINSERIQKGLILTVELARKTLGKVEISYKSGTSKLLEVESAENEYNKARIELLKEKLNYTNSMLELEALYN